MHEPTDEADAGNLRTLLAAIFLISAVGLAYQVTLMRIFAIAQWHHLAYMIISVAMLGFGTSGSAIAVGQRWIQHHESALLRHAAFLLPISLVACYTASQSIPFETFQLLSNPSMFWYLLLLYLVLAVPFFLVSSCIALAMMSAPQRIGLLYCANMLGSGVGALGVVGLLYWFTPSRTPFVLVIPAFLAFCLLTATRRRTLPIVLLSMLAVVGVSATFWERPIRVSEYKGLSYALQYPDARVVASAKSPFSVITAVESQLIRETPGQISNYPMSELGLLPPQIGLFFDGGAVSAVHRFNGDLQRFAYLDYVVSALAYRMLDKPSVLVVGAGGGTEVLSALEHGARHVTALDTDPSLFPLMRNELASFSGGLYDRSDVSTVTAEGRGYLQSHPTKYDLINIGLLDSFNASAAGVLALNESYLYTREALELYLSRLTDDGVLAITRWLKTPPRDMLKLFATAVEACEAFGIDNPEEHIVTIRSWNNALLLVRRAPLRAEDRAAVRQFCREREFDLCYYPGITQEETNTYTLLETPVYYDFAKDLFLRDHDTVLREALFYVNPATDDRPYFFRFFKWSALPRFLQILKTESITFVEWGYLLLLASILQGIVVGAVFILIPLGFLKGSRRHSGTGKWVFLSCASLGLAFMFIEIALIQRFMLFLAYPIYSITVVLAALLIFSGCGSLFGSRFSAVHGKLVLCAALSIIGLTIVYLVTLKHIFLLCSGWPDPAKIVLSIALLAPLAFAMGIPFPSVLQLIATRSRNHLPWAWGVNGFASVLGASLATLLAIHLGFTLVMLSAAALYLIAAIAVLAMQRRLETPVEK